MSAEEENPPEQFVEQVKRILEEEKDNAIFIAMAREMIANYVRGTR